MAVTVSLDLSQVEEGLIRIQGFTDALGEKLKPVMTEIGDVIRQDYIASIRSGAKSGRIYGAHKRVGRRGRKAAPGRMHQASAPGEAPASDTGRLVSFIAVRPFKTGIGASVVSGPSRSNDFYGRFLESGTKRILPRPALVPARDRHVQEFVSAVQEAIDEAVAEVSS